MALNKSEALDRAMAVVRKINPSEVRQSMNVLYGTTFWSRLSVDEVIEFTETLRKRLPPSDGTPCGCIKPGCPETHYESNS